MVQILEGRNRLARYVPDVIPIFYIILPGLPPVMLHNRKKGKVLKVKCNCSMSRSGNELKFKVSRRTELFKNELEEYHEYSEALVSGS